MDLLCVGDEITLIQGNLIPRKAIVTKIEDDLVHTRESWYGNYSHHFAYERKYIYYDNGYIVDLQRRWYDMCEAEKNVIEKAWLARLCET